jgi:hypothetical protein
VRWQQPFEKIAALDPHAAQVCERCAMALAVKLPHTAQQPFDTDEVPLRVPRGVFSKKCGVAAAEFHFERLARGEKLCQL